MSITVKLLENSALCGVFSVYLTSFRQDTVHHYRISRWGRNQRVLINPFKREIDKQRGWPLWKSMKSVRWTSNDNLGFWCLCWTLYFEFTSSLVFFKQPLHACSPLLFSTTFSKLCHCGAVELIPISANFSRRPDIEEFSSTTLVQSISREIADWCSVATQRNEFQLIDYSFLLMCSVFLVSWSTAVLYSPSNF